MTTLVKQLIDKFFPGFAAGQMSVGLTNVGISVVNATIACNTARTDAQIIASPPNTAAVGFACGAIVHSLGTAPTLSLLQPNGILPADTSIYAVNFAFITANNSAVFFRASTWTGTTPAGVSVKLFAIR